MTRKALLAKVRALLSKTVANGCTEAEALAALTKARAMMAEHDLTDADFAFGGEEVRVEAKFKTDRDHARDYLATAVAAFCNCKCWSGFSHEETKFCGLESDTIFAHWLLDMLGDFVGRELANYLERTWTPHSPSIRRTESNGFVTGCTGRIAQRLRELTPEPPSGNGRGLVVARNALIDRHMQALGIILKRPRSRLHRIDNRARRAGAAAGENAQFNRPLNDGEAVKQLGDDTW